MEDEEICDYCDQDAMYAYFGNHLCEDCYDDFLEQESDF